MNIRTVLKEGISKLRAAHVDSFTLAAELLLLHVLGRDRAWLYAHPDDSLPDSDTRSFFTLIERRAAGEPTQYLTGKQEFWSMEFEVTPDVLIPRPETEHLIEVALDRLAVRQIRAGGRQTLSGAGLQIIDVGTGSGCLAISLAKELPAAQITATDISAQALAVAQRNAMRHSVAERVCFLQHDLLKGFAGKYELIVSNPPYIGKRERETLQREVRDHEPEIALYGGEEGYELYGDLIVQAARTLMGGGLLVLELGHNSLAAVQPLLESPDWTNVGITNDLAGIPRVIAAERSQLPTG
jgi:release factor glutamine methyltransferase